MMGTLLRRWPLWLAFALLAWAFVQRSEITEIAAGVALFLFGMRLLEQGFGAFTGGTLERWLMRATDRTYKSIGFGFAATTLMQSSSLISLVTISFLSAGLINLAGGIGIIIGSNLGTTTGAWLIAGIGMKVDIGHYALPVLVFGVALVLQKPPWLKGLGYGLTGIGLVFLGIAFMKSGFDAWRETFDLAAYAISGTRGLLVFTLLGTVATVIMQSSHATLLVTITALATGQISYENGLALAIGANLGTTVTAIIGSISANLEGRRLAVAHFVFNAVTAAIAIVFLDALRWLVEELAELLRIAPDAWIFKLALFHTLFNLIGVALMTPAVGFTVRLLERLVRARPRSTYLPQHLSDSLLAVPDAAVKGARNELKALYEQSVGFFALGLDLPLQMLRGRAPLEPLVRKVSRTWPPNLEEHYEHHIKPLFGAIVTFISRAEARSYPERLAAELSQIRYGAGRLVEAVKAMKHLHVNLARHQQSPDRVVREEYTRIRLYLAELIQEMDRSLGQDQADEVEARFEDWQRAAHRFEAGLNRRIDELIRSGQIPTSIATSLMNDAAYTRRISKNLIRTVAVVLGRGRMGAHEEVEAAEIDS